MNKSGLTAIQKVQNLNQLVFLHKAGADLNRLNAEGRKSILQICIARGKIPMIEYLLKNGANPNTAGVRRVLTTSSSEIFTILYQNGFRPTLFIVRQAVRRGDVERLRLLKELRWDITSMKWDDANPLILQTAFSPNDSTARFLISEGYDIDQTCERGLTVLHYISGSIAKAQQIIDKIENGEDIPEIRTNMRGFQYNNCLKCVEEYMGQYKRMIVLGADPTIRVAGEIGPMQMREGVSIPRGSTPLDILPDKYRMMLKPPTKGAHFM